MSATRWMAVVATTCLIVVLTPAMAAAATVGPPTGLTATSGNQEVSLSWTAPALGGNPAITDYFIDYSTDANSWTQFIHNASATASATVTSLTNGTLYYFRVAAFNSDGNGSYSAMATATPLSNHTRNDLATFRACPPGIAPSAGFSDHSSSAVDCVKYYGITLGTTTTTYSPLDAVTRWQMALFLTRMAVPAGVVLGSGLDQGFVDIGGKSTEIQTAINQIKQLGITVGKTATTFAPDDNVTREEMALFLARLLKQAKVGPGGNTEYITGTSGFKEIKSNDADHNFTDLTGVTLYESLTSIASLWNLGVTESATATVYEPQKAMTRQAMATMMTNALAHTNARPSGINLQATTYRVGGTPTITFSATHRTSAFAPVAGTIVDTFKYDHSIVSTVVRFDTTGACSSTVVTSVGSTKCTVDSADPTTDTDGNLALFYEYMPSILLVDLWAWTAAIGTTYDNDVHATDASKITVEITAGS
jgi:hypothetical protein